MRRIATQGLCALMLLFACAGWVLAEVTEAVTFETAKAAFQAGDYAQAAKEFELLVGQHPDWASGLVTLAQSYYFLGRDDLGQANVTRAVALDPDVDAFAAYYAVGRALYRQRDFERALAPLRQALDLAAPQHQPTLTNMLAHAQLKTGRLQEARQVLESREPLDPVGLRYLSLACQREGDYDCALTELRSSIPQAGERAVAWAKDLAQWSHYWAQKPVNADRKALLVAQAVNDTRTWFEASAAPAALRLYADALLAADRAEDLITTVKAKLSSDATDCLGLLLLAEAENARRNSGTAEAWARQAIECDPESVPGRLELAIALVGQLRAEHSEAATVESDLLRIGEASTIVEQALRLDSTDSRAQALASELTAATARLSDVAEAIAAHAGSIKEAELKEIRNRCLNLVWRIRDETSQITAAEGDYYKKHDCPRFAERSPGSGSR